MNITDMIFNAIDIVNEQIIDGSKIEKSNETVLLGDASTVDSLSLVNLIVAIEDAVSRNVGHPVSLVDEDLLSSGDQPLRTVGSLASFIENKLKDS